MKAIRIHRLGGIGKSNMYYDLFQKYRKPTLYVFGSFIVLCIVMATVTYVTRIGKTGLTVSAVPYDSSVTINGNVVGSGTTWLTPGSYKITVQKPGFQSREKTVNVPTQDTVAMALTPQSTEAKKWAAIHENEYENNQYYGAIEASQAGKAFEEKHPIVRALPYNDPYFQIDYKRNTDDTITLTIATPSPRYRYYALKKIIDYGYKPADFKLEFSDFSNPLLKTRNSDE